jgi:hypothetical protein
VYLASRQAPKDEPGRWLQNRRGLNKNMLNKNIKEALSSLLDEVMFD